MQVRLRIAHLPSITQTADPSGKAIPGYMDLQQCQPPEGGDRVQLSALSQQDTDEVLSPDAIGTILVYSLPAIMLEIRWTGLILISVRAAHRWRLAAISPHLRDRIVEPLHFGWAGACGLPLISRLSEVYGGYVYK